MPANCSPESLVASTPAGLAWLANKRYQYAPHLVALNRKLLDVAAGRTRRLLVCMPPRHGKSELVSATFPTWYLGMFPDKRVILASYSLTLAERFGRAARDLMAEYGPLFGVALRQDSQATTRWDIRKHKGGMAVAGVGGSLTGQGADLLIVDDPVRNQEDADSLTIRESTYDWYRSVARTRLTPKGAIVLAMTRWHHDDLAGRLLRDQTQGGEQWETLILPAIAEGDDPLGRKPGQALWPEQFNEANLVATRGTVGMRVWNALYQQRPSPAQGSIIRREWLGNRYRALPAMRQVVASLDSAFKTGASSDYSCLSVWGQAASGYYLIDLLRERLEFPQLLRAIQDIAAQHQPNAVLVEDAASGQSAIQVLRQTTTLPVIAVKPQGSKQSRADAVAPLFEAGKVWLPETAAWLAEYVEELVAFPVGEHDDQVDSTTMALARLARGGVVEYTEVPVLDMAPAFALLGQSLWNDE